MSSHSHIEATVNLLELSIAYGPEEQKSAINSVFERLWRAPSSGLSAPCPASGVGISCSSEKSQAKAATDSVMRQIPSSAAGKKFMEQWKEEIGILGIVQELQE